MQQAPRPSTAAMAPGARSPGTWSQPKGARMIKVKTFTTPIKIFATVREIQELDEQVTTFLNEEGADKVFSVSDSTTAGENGETIGLIRTVAYRVGE
jgi:hypothetical protein